MKLTKAERNLITEYERAGTAIVTEITRKSDREFDLTISGTYRVGGRAYSFSAWLVLGCINLMTEWHRNPIARMTDIPEMTRAGDWSGVRDSEESTIWDIFLAHVKHGGAQSVREVK